MNHEITKLQIAINSLKSVTGCELEILRLTRKLEALINDKDKEGRSGIDLIKVCTDEEIIALNEMRDPRLGLHPFPSPDCYNYLRIYRPNVFRQI